MPAAGEPLSHPQQQIALGQQLNPDSPLYNMAFALVIPAPISVPAFLSAWQIVADSSEALRTQLLQNREGAIARVLLPRGPATRLESPVADAPDREGFLWWCLVRCWVAVPLYVLLCDSILVESADG